MNERIKQVRLSQSPKMSQDAFGARLGITGAAVSRIESGDRSVTDQVIKAICREFDVSEYWLRTGDGSMEIPKGPDKQLDEILEQIASSEGDLIKKIIKAYWALDDKEKAAIRKPIDGLCEK